MPNVDPIGGIILAAGNSLRFGGDKRFEVMPEGKTLLEETIRSAMTCIARILVVLRKDDEFGDRLNGFVNDRYLRFFCAPDSDQGMGSSLANSISELENWQAALVILGDMPYIKQETYETLIAAYQTDSKAIIVPVYQGKTGHPVLFDRCYFPELEKISGDQGAKSIIEANPQHIINVEVDDPGILLDIDKPEDLKSS